MTYYHRNKEAALAAATKYEGDWEPRAAFVPYNGWVIVLSPLSKDVFRKPLLDMLDEVEIDLTCINLLRRKPADYKPPPTIERAAPREPRQPGQAAAPRPKMEVIDVAPGSIAPPWASKPAAAPPSGPPSAPSAPPASPIAAPAPKPASGPPSEPQPVIKAPWQR